MYCDRSSSFDFLTLRYLNFRNPWKDAASKKRLLTKLKATKKRLGLSVAAYVVLDDHAHILLRAQAGQGGTKLMDELRSGFCEDCQLATESCVNPSADLEHRALVGTLQTRAHLDFIHYEPVMYGLVDRAVDYDWSSFPIRVAQGHYPENWAVLAPPASIARVPL